MLINQKGDALKKENIAKIFNANSDLLKYKHKTKGSTPHTSYLQLHLLDFVYQGVTVSFKH